MVITLLFLLLLTGVVVALLLRGSSALRSSELAAASNRAEQLSHAASLRVIAEVQAEIRQANTEGLNLLLPVRYGEINADPRVSRLVRRSMEADSTLETAYGNSGFSGVPFANLASSEISSNQPFGGPVFRKARWNAPRLMDENPAFDTFTVPDWIYLTKSGPKKSPSSAGEVVGRFAYMLYDVGGLFDLESSGYSSTTSDLDVKGGSVFADLDAYWAALDDTADFDTFIQWRNGGGPPPKVDSSESLFGGDGGSSEAGWLERGQGMQDSGQNRLLTREALIAAAEQGRLGLTAALLPHVRVGSQASNRVSARDIFADNTGNPISLLDPSLAADADKEISVYRLDGTQEPHTVYEGTPLFQHRFPLSRLRWFSERESNGTPLRQDEIKLHFGLTWDPANRMFIYTSPEADSAVSEIKTLQLLASDINNASISPREPDFFEWLKAAIDPDSLGQTGGTTNRSFTSGDGNSTAWEISKNLHLLRIGANIIDQADPDSIPTGIRSQFTGVDPAPFDSFGVENLPYLNEVLTSVLRNGNDLEGFFQFEMWNPHREAFTNRVPRGYDGQPIQSFRIGTDSGRVLMEPMVYVRSRNNYNYSPPETDNQTWRAYKAVADYSKDNLTVADFNSPNLSGNRITLNFNGSGYDASTDFFDEPALINAGVAFGVDRSNPSTTFNGEPVTLGAEPISGQNAILASSVNAPNPAFSGVPLMDPNPGGPGQTSNGIYANGTTDGSGNSPTISPSGAKVWNAVAFKSDGETRFGVSTEPVTLVLEVESGGVVFPAGKYHRLALNRWVDPERPGQQVVVLAQDPNTSEEANWTGNSDSTRCFGDWSEYFIRKGYPMTDPRTERFGLADHLRSSPGMGIRSDTDSVSGNGITWNIVHGLTASVGTDFNGSGTAGNWPAQPGWSLQAFGAQKVSLPAALALNYVGNPIGAHTNQDSDGVVRPADARWTSADSHPALPVANFSNAINARPTILDRPFRNVGELGVVFRDIPWKSLDLFSPESSDGRLLDIFCVEDAANVPGRINPNSADAAALEALISGSGYDPAGLVSGAVAKGNDVATHLSGIQVSDLNSLLEEMLGNTAASPSDPNAESPYKLFSEAHARAIAAATDTRSWQLLLDLVVQSGRQPGGDTSFDPQRFLVSGQRRYWITFSIDRFTGEITHEHWEPVYE